MRIAFNTTAFIPGKMGGTETYFRELLASLQQADTENDYSLLIDAHYAAEFPLTSPRFKKVACNFTEPSFLWLVRGVLRNTLKVDILKSVLNRLPVDLIHHPFSILNPPGLKIPSVLTFHDMQHEFLPQFFSDREMRTGRELSRTSAEDATRIIAISAHVKTSLVKKYQIPADKIDVVYNGYSPEYRVIDDRAALAQIRDKYALECPFLYFPAATWPHKNHKRLLAALRLLVDDPRFDGDLVLTGISMKAHDELLTEIERLRLTERVKILGYLPYAELPYLYNLARLLVFPSLFEGFGLPLVEAMACGCPVACSNVTAIPEVVGNAGLLFDPTSEEQIAVAVRDLWENEERRKQLITQGFERARRFRWENAARETIDVYKKALGIASSAAGAEQGEKT